MAPENGLFGGISLYICNDSKYMLKLDVKNKTTKLKYKKFKFTAKITAQVYVVCQCFGITVSGPGNRVYHTTRLRMLDECSMFINLPT